ncbi:MAG: hypothetical protein QW244_02565 [Candidatus Pacearchaeota archaeon]
MKEHIERENEKKFKVELGYNIYYERDGCEKIGVILPNNNYEVWAILDMSRRDRFVEKLRNILNEAPMNESEKKKIFENEEFLFLRLINVVKKYYKK